VDSVPENFKLTVKIPTSVTLTHFYKKNKTDPLVENPHFLSVDLFEQFLKSIQPLRRNLGPLMFQFEYLNKQKMSSQGQFQETFAAFMERVDPDYDYLIEIRNPNYLNRNYFQFLNAIGSGHVFLQGYYMPSITQIYQKFSEHITDLTVIRLHGPDRSDIEKKSGGNWNSILEPKDGEMEKIAKMVTDLLERKVDIYINMNNHYEGSAPLSIQRLQKLIVSETK
jgi:uncharacterized protein YecE (DUF72 family)